MSDFDWIVIGLGANMLVGACVWASLDAKDGRLFKWYDECPPLISWWAQPLTLFLWPVGIWACWKWPIK